MDSGMQVVMEFNDTYDGILISISSSAIVYLSTVPYTSSSLGQSWDVPKASINITVPMVNNNVSAPPASSFPLRIASHFVKKPNGQHHLACNFRSLNNLTVPDMYPMATYKTSYIVPPSMVSLLPSSLLKLRFFRY